MTPWANCASSREAARADVLENQLLDAVLALAKVYGFRTVHWRAAKTAHGWRTPVQGDGKGWPDLLLVKGRRIIAAELKIGTAEGLHRNSVSGSRCSRAPVSRHISGDRQICSASPTLWRGRLNPLGYSIPTLERDPTCRDSWGRTEHVANPCTVCASPHLSLSITRSGAGTPASQIGKTFPLGERAVQRHRVGI